MCKENGMIKGDMIGISNLQCKEGKEEMHIDIKNKFPWDNKSEHAIKFGTHLQDFLIGFVVSLDPSWKVL